MSTTDHCEEENALLEEDQLSLSGRTVANISEIVITDPPEKNPHTRFSFSSELNTLWFTNEQEEEIKKHENLIIISSDYDPSTINKQENYLLIIIPKKINSFGGGCFRNFTNLKSIQVCIQLEKVGHYCFAGCTSLEKLNIQGKVTYGNYCFLDCNLLKFDQASAGDVDENNVSPSEDVDETEIPSNEN
jgi:hypothetical protein